jgi:hypothetical protein
MIDIWPRLQLIFNIPEPIYPEIEVVGLTEKNTRWLATYMVKGLRGINTQFRTFFSEDVLLINSPQAIINGVASGDYIGAMSGELAIDGFHLPEILYIFEEPGYMVMSYMTGTHWTPIKLTALFELFRIVKTIQGNCKVQLSDGFFSDNWIQKFNGVLKSYLDETI